MFFFLFGPFALPSAPTTQLMHACRVLWGPFLRRMGERETSTVLYPPALVLKPGIFWLTTTAAAAWC